MNPVAQYVLSLATCVIGYFAYLKYAVPMIEQPAARSQQFAQRPNHDLIPTVNKNSLIPLLPPEAWELHDCKTLITSTGTILFKEVSPQPDGTVKLSPFTMMTNVGEQLLLDSANSPAATQEAPIVLRTNEGAMLKLNKPFNESLQGGTEIKSARLLGQVDIYRPPSGPDKADVLHVLTRNVQVDRNRIYTLDTLDKPFLFSYGPHRGRGRNLIIDLVHSENTVTGKQDFSSISGIRRIELAYLDRLRIVPSKAQPSTADASASKLFSAQDSPLEVTCKGPCVFDFLDQTVAFSDRVVVKKISPGGDSITCQRLQIKFNENPLADKSKPEPSDGQLADQPNGPKQELSIESLIAEGTPVIVNANSRQAKITAARLIYDATTDLFRGFAGPSSGGMVNLVTPDIQYKTEQLNCKLAVGLDNKKTLDSLSAPGPGQLLKHGKTPAEKLFVRWTESLNTARDRRDPSIQTLVLKGNTHVDFQETSSIDAQRIDLKLKRFEKTKDSPSDQAEFSIMEIVANQNVQIKTPEITGKTDRLIAEFPNPIPMKSHKVSRPRYQSSGGLQFAAPPSSNPTQIRRAGGIQAGIGFPTNKIQNNNIAKQKLPSNKHLNFSGQQVRISILEATNESFAFEDLIINGDVSVTQSAAKQPNALELTGDHLRIVPQTGDKRFRLELTAATGQAAIRSPEFSLDGQNIHLDQVDNKLWVEGPGKLNFDNSQAAPVPTRVGAVNRGGFTQSAGVGVDRNAVRSIAKFNATWRGGMIFDGNKIYLERDVVSETEQADGSKHNMTQATCGQMSVALNRYVNFEQLKQDKRDATAKSNDIKPTELIFIDKVDPLNQVFGQVPVDPTAEARQSLILNRAYDSQGRLIQQQTISSQQVRVDPTSRNIFADGPGWISTHDLKSPGNPRSNRASKHPLAGLASKKNDSSKPITFVRVNFADRMAVESAKNQMQINGRVRVVHLQTNDWRTNADPDRIPPALQDSAVLLTSERLTLARWQPRDSTEKSHEMIADGNVRILGDTIDLSSNRVSYNQANDLLVVNGTNRTAAKIRYRDATGSGKSWQEFSAEKFEYQIASQTVNVNGVQRGEAIRID